MNTKENQRTRLTKQLFRESLIRLLEKSTIYEITVSQLCSAAEINRSTFYKYYGNVRDIYEEIEQAALEASAACIAGINVHDENSIIKRVEELLTQIKSNSELYRLLLENSADGEFPYKLIEGAVGAVTSTHRLSTDNGQKYAEYCSLFMVSGALSIIRKWLNSGMKESEHELAALIFQIATGRISFCV